MNTYLHISKIFSKHTLALILVLSAVISPLAAAQDYVWAPAFPVGSNIPVLEAPDQFGQPQTLASLSGEKGIVLLFNRSFDWCPFCKAQLINLDKVKTQFTDLGFNVVTITYDSVDTLLQVAEDQGITFSMLHDENIKHVNAFQIRNMDYSPGDRGYGIPEPGIMVINPEGEILAKFAEENFRIRPDFGDVIAAVRSL